MKEKTKQTPNKGQNKSSEDVYSISEQFYFGRQGGKPKGVLRKTKKNITNIKML